MPAESHKVRMLWLCGVLLSLLGLPCLRALRPREVETVAGAEP
jgi:hypothetical protein